MTFFCEACGVRSAAPGACPKDRTPLVRAPHGSLLGESVGNYVAVAELGSGGMGMVLRAIHPGIGAQVAIKVLNASCAFDPSARERLRREAQAVNLIANANVPKVSDAGVLADGRPYLVMELLTGQNLAQVIERTPRPPLSWSVGVAIDVLDVAHAAHVQGIVHRDLKPENVFITSSARTVVLDFGVAKLLHPTDGADLTNTGAAIGTPSYMAPEQITGGSVDARSDIYSVGALLYELIAGRRPFLGSDFEVLSAHCDRRPAPPRAWFPEIPIDLQGIVLTSLAKRPDDRFQSANAMKTALGHVAHQLR